MPGYPGSPGKWAAKPVSFVVDMTASEMEEEVDDEEEEEDAEAEESMKHDQLTAFLEQMELQYRKQ